MVSHCSAAVCVDPGVAMSKDHGGGDLCVIYSDGERERERERDGEREKERL